MKKSPKAWAVRRHSSFELLAHFVGFQLSVRTWMPCQRNHDLEKFEGRLEGDPTHSRGLGGANSVTSQAAALRYWMCHSVGGHQHHHHHRTSKGGQTIILVVEESNGMSCRIWRAGRASSGILKPHSLWVPAGSNSKSLACPSLSVFSLWQNL